jgi:hypothetical protein
LAAQLRELLRDRAERQRLGRLGQERVRERHTAHRMAAETLAVYQRYLPW